MSILTRMKDMTKATIHEVLDTIEDPVMMLNQYLRDMEQEITQAEIALTRHLAMEKRTKMMIDEMKQRVEKRLRQAQLAILHQQEDIARQALADKQLTEERLGQSEQDYLRFSEQTQMLRGQLQELKDKFYEMKHKRASLMARANVAAASQRIHHAMYAVNSETAARGFARIEERIQTMEIDAEVSKKLHGLFHSEQAHHPNVEAELEKLKQKRAEVIVE